MTIEITKKELRDLYMNNPNKVVCKRLGVTEPTLKVYLKKAGIEQKGSGYHSRTGNRARKVSIID